jgi:hypothetical protein
MSEVATKRGVDNKSGKSLGTRLYPFYEGFVGSSFPYKPVGEGNS